MSDVIIVGGGASAIAAAMEFSERSVVPLILDVGVLPANPVTAAGNFYDYRSARDSFDLTIGQRYQGLANLTGARRVPVKLATPNAEYVTRGAEKWAPVDEAGFHAVQSFAMGGLANAWGGGLYRFNHVDMAGFPIEPSDLDRYFDRLTAEIGITGDDDDLTPFFGSTAGLLPPIRFSYNMERLYHAYRRKKGRLPTALRLGRPRLAALTEVFDGRAPIAYDNMEFWQETPALYTPRHTLQKLIARQRVQYRNGVLVRSFTEEDGGVTVHATDVESETPLSFRCRALVVAAGVINTSKIVLESLHDHETRLPLLENPAVQIPFVLPGSIGRPLDTAAFGLTQLNLVWESESYGARCQGSLIELTSPLRAEFFASLPYAARANLALMRHLLPCMFVMQLYLPGSGQRPFLLSLQKNGRLHIEGHPDTFDLDKARPLFRFMRALGAWTRPSRIVRVPMGHAIHYAGTLPMSRSPRPYQCTTEGLLHPTRRVYVGDSASFPQLPAKNMSLGMMANAMRIAAHVSRRLSEER